MCLSAASRFGFATKDGADFIFGEGPHELRADVALRADVQGKGRGSGFVGRVENRGDVVLAESLLDEVGRLVAAEPRL